MLKNPFDLSFDQLPDTLPIFPLDGVLLLPGGQVPLNIFELRYLNMIQDALAARDRMIGMILPSSQPKHGGHVSLHSIGCAGRITSFEETADGRFLVTLTGYCRFQVEEEMKTIRGYRRVVTNWSAFKDDLDVYPNPDIDRDRLLLLLKRFMQYLAIDMDWGAVSQTPNFNLITFFAMSLPFSNSDRQSLLEAQTDQVRAQLMESLIVRELQLVGISVDEDL